MEAALKNEYELVHREIVDVRSCVTAYVNMFFTVGVGVVALFTYLATKDVLFDKSGNKLLSLSPTDLAYVPLVLAYINLSFTSILFHKFNTHNRACGYLRALEQERVIKADSNTPAAAPPSTDDIRLWQSALAVPFQKDKFRWGYVRRVEHFQNLKNHVDERDRECEHPFVNMGRTLRFSSIGFGMIIRSTIFRVQTRSWTFPFQIAFGPFWVMLLLMGAWGVLSFHGGITLQVLLPSLLVIHLMSCWLGLGYRMYRLCAIEGDRTIETWFWRTVVQRRKALNLDQVVAEYRGWFPDDACDEM